MASSDLPGFQRRLVWVAFNFVSGNLSIRQAARDLGVDEDLLANHLARADLMAGNYGAFIAWIEGDPSRSRAWKSILDQQRPLPCAVPSTSETKS